MRKCNLLLLSLFLWGSATFAGGYQVGLHSMRNTGMGLIGTSLYSDASALFYNPGGASFLNETWNFSGGLSFLMTRTTFQAKDVMYQTHIKDMVNTPFYFYAAGKPLKDFCVGLSVNTPYGNGLQWDDNWEGRFLIQKIAFKAITIQPTVSYKIKDIIGIGVGFVVAYGDVNLTKAIPLNGTTSEGSMHISGTAINYGFNAGIQVHPVKGLSLGVDYRSKIDMKVKKGKATFNVPSSLSTEFPENKVDVTLPLVSNLDFGASYETGKWMFGLNLCYVMWSEYDSLSFSFEKETSYVQRTVTPSLYISKLIPRIGVQYKVNDIITARIGGYYDASPVRDNYLDPQTPSDDEIGITCGVSIYPLKGLSIDAAFLYLMGIERDGSYSPDNFSGTYKNTLYSPGIGLTYQF
ncbi:MAG: outer membrane protein transport protein [Bacteroidota bacterium]|nr:outer membrane protein transport protein [Bacteroidota bacterium]